MTLLRSFRDRLLVTRQARAVVEASAPQFTCHCGEVVEREVGTSDAAWAQRVRLGDCPSCLAW